MKRQRLYTPFNKLPQMLLEPKFSYCMWCKREFTLRGFSEENDLKLGRVRRSHEHIIPESLFGRIKSPDVCADCNATFGCEIDPALLRDGAIITAAESAGIKLPELLAQFEGYHKTASGRPVKTKVQRGVFHPKPRFHDEGFGIAMTDGKFRANELSNAKAKMFVLVRRNPGCRLSDGDIRGEINQLFLDAVRNPEQTIFNPRIGQGIRSELLDKKVRVTWTYHPWETQWAIAKIAYESSLVLWPNEYVRYCAPVLDVFRKFIEARELGAGIFEQESLGKNSVRAHELNCELSPASLSWRITLFGLTSWMFATTFRPHPKAPKQAFTIRFFNPFADAAGPVLVEVLPFLEGH